MAVNPSVLLYGQENEEGECDRKCILEYSYNNYRIIYDDKNMKKS